MQTLTTRNLLKECAQNNADDVAFSYNNADHSSVIRETYSDLYKKVVNVGSFLVNKGYKKKHIAILSENSFEWMLSFFSITASGNVAVLLDTNLNSENLKQLLEFNDCEALIYSSMFEKEVNELKSSLNIEYIFNKDLLDIASKDDETMLTIDVNEEDCAAIAFTSGSSGIRKGVLLKHKGLVGDAISVSKHVFVPGSYLHFLPSYHLFAILGILTAIYLRRETYVCTSIRYLTKGIEATNPEIFACVPSTLPLIYSGISKFGYKQREIVCGGAPNSLDLASSFKQLGSIIINGYGLTECSPCISISDIDNYEKGSMHILDINEVKIDEKDSDGIGEVLVKGDNVMCGYYKLEKENEAVFKDGYFCTGDLGRIDEDGFLYILGRKKNILVLPNGENIAPEPLENEITTINGVKECIVNISNGVLQANIYAEGVDEAYIKEEIKAINAKHNFANRITNIKLFNEPFKKGPTGKILRKDI